MKARLVTPFLLICATLVILAAKRAGLSVGNDQSWAQRPDVQRDAASSAERPLPLAGHWNLGEEKDGFDPAYQIRLMEQGHHLLPWFLMPNVFAETDDPRWLAYYEAAMKRAARLKLPISLVGTQWEGRLSFDDRYFKLPAERNANVIAAGGEVTREASPFSAVETWREVGKAWTSSQMMKKLQEWYPDPPMVLFVSNNEHARLPWNRVEEDRRYIEKFGKGRSDEFKRKVVAEGWLERYRALLDGMREGISNAKWRQQAVFIGYDAFGPSHFARWPGWLEYSLYTNNRIDPWPLVWDGASPPYYVFNWSAITDYTMYSPQIEAMNWVFMLDEARRINPKYWFELSTWDGHEPGMENDKRKTYARAGQTYTPERYGGMVQFGMWLLRPRTVREFRGYQDTLAQAESYFLPIVAAVDRVHNNATLNSFWRTGELVANRAHQHPYQSLVPKEYQNVDRWFLLDTSLDPPRPWELGTQLPVYSLALVKGRAPHRQWLIYAHSPLKARDKVQVTVPGQKPVTINVDVGGSFYLVDEGSLRVQAVK
jgi:hypothetical protein